MGDSFYFCTSIMIDNFFAKQLLSWHHLENNRILPWKGEKDPYKIWISEIILQQTRAEQGLPYYERFIATYPTIEALAAAPDQEVFKLWQGLGYYSRCRNLLATARQVVAEYGGKFPDQYAQIIQLKGIGPYTAAAIASFAFGIAVPVIDGNVYRVMARYFAAPEPMDTTTGKKKFNELVTSVFDERQPAAFNQAIMDLGASVCMPKQAKCEGCFLSSGCRAYRENSVYVFPVKTKKIAVRHRYFNYYILEVNEELYLQQRPPGDVWHDLYEFFLVESENAGTTDFLDQSLIEEEKPHIFRSKQRLTHQLIESKFSIIKLKKKPRSGFEKGAWIKKINVKNYPFPKTIISFLEEMPYF
ncbi:MAG: A/G-specific adenine glycosylase [Sphingobacteriales bacterium]|nr:MAG: A/G-specific adenine glycosylase [Sphingobacteriales bacterium]